MAIRLHGAKFACNVNVLQGSPACLPTAFGGTPDLADLAGAQGRAPVTGRSTLDRPRSRASLGMSDTMSVVSRDGKVSNPSRSETT